MHPIPNEMSSDCGRDCPLSGVARQGVRLYAADALAQSVHQIDDVLAPRSLFRGDGFAGALLVDEIDKSGFVLGPQTFSNPSFSSALRQ